MNGNAAIRTPRPVTGVDLRRLPIGPEEAFVLSRVDGRTSELELSHATGIEMPRVHHCLARLAELGAIKFDCDGPQVAATMPLIDLPLYDPRELEEAVDLDPARKRKILDVYYRLEELTHYELLQVPESADKKQVKNAYFEVVSLFHPDKYFGKNLGSFKAKLEKVFARLTEAHDTLSRGKPRQEYDDYLRTQRKNRDLERVMGGEADQAAEIERVQRHIEEQAALGPAAELPPPDPEVRRKALARKLRSNPAMRMPTVAPPSTSQQQAGEDLKRRYDERREGARARQLAQYLAQVEQALVEKNISAAANAMRIAASLAPNDPEITARLEDIQSRANVELAQNYLEQGQYEERSQRYVEAARSYERAARGKPTAALFERITECLLAANTDLRRAGEYARKASVLAPDDAGLRVTLARVYLAAGMKQSAITELERTSEQFPGDDRAKALLKLIKRGEV